MDIVLRVRKKGILILPKALRTRVGIEENSEVLVEVKGDAIILRPLKPKVVDVDTDTIKKIVEEEKREWEERLDELTTQIST